MLLTKPITLFFKNMMSYSINSQSVSTSLTVSQALFDSLKNRLILSQELDYSGHTVSFVLGSLFIQMLLN